MTPPVSVRELVRRAAARLDAAGVPSGSHDAAVLVAHVLEVEPAALVARETCSREQADRVEALVDRRAERIPLQHLTGRAYFRHVEVLVGPGVFVPRPETEVVVEAAIREVRRLDATGVPAPLVVDLCTGSGAIAASVAVETPTARVVAVELSPEAHAWARRNLGDLPVDLRLGDASDACQDLDGTVDVVISNPPYIPPGSMIRDPEVAAHDPALALWGGGEDGLDTMRAVVDRAGMLLRAGGLLVVEHADLQGAGVVALVEDTGRFDQVEDHQDLTGRDRFTTARRSGGGSGP